MAQTALNTTQHCLPSLNLLEISNSKLYNIEDVHRRPFMKTSILYSILLICLASISNLSASSLLDSDNSFAEEYKNLRILLSKVQDKNSALLHKQAIEKEIQRLNQNHQSGEDQFNSLSVDEKKLFIKKFQKNRFHCGEVTQVMEQRKRILFQPELSKILSNTLANIP